MMFGRKSFLKISKHLIRNFSETAKAKPYSITAFGEPPGGVNWVSSKTQEENRIEHELEGLLGALAGCEGGVVNYYANKEGVSIKDIQFKIEADYDFAAHLDGTNKPNRFTDVRVNVELDTDASSEEIDKIKDFVKKHCPVVSMLRLAGVEYHSTWKKKGEAQEEEAKEEE